jgi:uncharacterized protein YneF (UPF0154 family)
MEFKTERDELKDYIAKDARIHYIEENNLNKYQLEEKLMYITNCLWEGFGKIVNPIRHKIQTIESEILVNKYELDESLKHQCSYKDEAKNIKEEIDITDKMLGEHQSSIKKIEDEYKSGAMNGDLKRFPMWVFVFLMTIAGLAEIAVYFNVFLSQEIGLGIDNDSAIDELFYKGMALLMAFGFTVMLIWLSHKLGMMLRQYISVKKEELKAYWIKFIVILAIVIGAIVSTVIIRSQMHEVLSKEVMIVAEQDKEMMSSLSLDDISEKDSDSLDMNMDMEENNNISKEKNLRNEINEMKGDAAYLFIMINFFIVISGVFLSYEVHTSSIKYEAIESIIYRLKKKKNALIKKHKRLIKIINKQENKVLIPIISKYVQSINLFDENSQVIKSYTTTIENIYIEMCLFMLGTMEDHGLLDDIDIKELDSYTKEHFINRFQEEWKLYKIDLEVEEIIHINNIEEFISSFTCKKEIENV